MSGVKVIGGLLAIFGGIFILIQIIRDIDAFSMVPYAFILNFAIGGAAIIGGVFGIKGQSGAGEVALLAGVLSIVLGIIWASTMNDNLWQFSLISGSFNIGSPGFNLFSGVSLEAIFIAVGGVLVMVGGSD